MKNIQAILPRLATIGIVAFSSATLPVLAAPVELSDVPVFSASSVPANLMLALSVEFPTGTVAAYKDSPAYDKANSYVGYFDTRKCYTYSITDNYFSPVGLRTGNDCSSTQFNGNYLNFVTMTALDEFRQSLSGGNRSTDLVGLTVLERSRMTGQGSGGNFPTKVTAASGQVPVAIAATGNVWARSRNGSTEFCATPACLPGEDRGVFVQFANNSGFNVGGTNILVQYYARVKVCDVGAGLEDNCTAYGGNYKPEGLIQQNAERIRVGAAGYLYRNGTEAPNGVIRAAVRDVGPLKYNGLAAKTANPFAEWDGTTGIFVTNPDPASAAIDYTVANSGAINYLNKFGQTNPYMTTDTISELYWSSLAYFMQLPLDPSYTAGLLTNPGRRDDFPVIPNDSQDPIAYSCQGNAIVVIGDNHTHRDSAVPGSTVPAEANHNAGRSPVAGVNASAMANALGALPLLEANSGNPYSPTAEKYLPGAYRSGLGSQYVPSAATRATYYIAGLAYYAHITDIRPDVAANANTTGKQTIDTFIVDVLEPGGADGTGNREHFDPNVLGSRGPSQYWLAAKYGGFDDVNEDGIPASYLTWHTNSSSGKDTRPDNWFPGNRPDLIRSGLAQIFNRVSSKKILSAVGPGTSTTRSLSPVDTSIYNTTAAGFSIYTTKYKPGDWTGDVSASIAAINPDGTISPVTAGVPPVAVSQWSAQPRLDAMTQILDASSVPVGWNTTRRIVTKNGANGVPFRWANLSTAQKTALRNDQDLLKFLRGDRSQEGIKFRSRRSALGGIVNSEAVLVQAAQSPSYSDSLNPGYAAFRTAKVSRPPVVYVGANDGMLHAFAADFSNASPAGAPNGGGSELFAYVPSFLFNGPSSPATPDVDGLAAISNLTGITATPYEHRFYVDQTPQVSDADFNRVSGNADGSTGAPDWRTLLVGSAGKGGKGIYALDITDVPAALANGTSAVNENLIKNKVLWEFTPPDMGFLYGKPIVAKTRKHGWVVLVTSGYNNSTGVGKLFVLNAATGVLLETLSTGVGSAATPSGLGRAAAYTQNFADNTIEQVYAGDLLGNVWRFDLAGTGTYAAPVKLASLIAPDGNPQPITTAPRVETDIDLTGLGTRRWVFFGTGQFLDLDDLTSTQTQSMYAFRDGTAALPGCEVGATSTPGVCTSTGHDLPLVRADLLPITDVLVGVTVADSDGGWYFDLPGFASSTIGSASERIIVDLDTQAGVPIVAWATLVPTDDPCQYFGAIYAINYASGKTALLSSGGVPIASVIPPGGAPTKVGIQQLPDGTLGLLFGALDGGANVQALNAAGLTSILSRTNWREILN